MKAPLRAHPEPASYQDLKINDDPKKLDAMYIRFLGRDGHRLLSEETKWLAVTHKSFDHGRRGFNDRLAFLGKRILELQTSLALLSTGKGSKDLPGYKDPLGRAPFQHPALDGAEALLGTATGFFLHHKQLSALSATYGIPEMVRWWPKRPDKLTASGCDMVYTQAVLAILGGIALEQGGAMANRIAKERVLVPMGLKPATSEIRGSMDGTI